MSALSSRETYLIALLKDFGLTFHDEALAEGSSNYLAGVRSSVFIHLADNDDNIHVNNISGNGEVHLGSGSEFHFNERGEFICLDIMV